MALKGTLADMSIIDLIQFPHSGRKTGHLIITGEKGEAKLFYEDGALVHSELGDVSGMDALVRIVDLGEGAFEFIPDAEPAARSIDLDLHRAVMQALKIHDELKMEEAKRRDQEHSAQDEGDQALCARLSEFIASNDFIVHAGVLDSGGRLRASANGAEGPPEGIDQLRSNLHSVVQSHPRGAVIRILLEDDPGIIALVRLREGGSLLAMAKKTVSLGAVSMSVSRLAMALE